MTLPVYDWVESPSTSKALQANVTTVSFGDGYAQRTPSGLNPVKQVWNVVHNNVDAAIADEIDAFLQDGLGWKAFSWTPPRQTVALTFICTAFTRTQTDTIDVENITATFEQDFRP